MKLNKLEKTIYNGQISYEELNEKLKNKKFMKHVNYLKEKQDS